MARPAETYRAARRNAHHGNWPVTRGVKVQVAPAVRPNKRDRSRDEFNARVRCLFTNKGW